MIFDWNRYILLQDSLPNLVRQRCHVDVTYHSFLRVPHSEFFCCLREFWGASRFTWAEPDVAAATILTRFVLAQGSWEARGVSSGTQNVHCLGGSQKVQGTERSGIEPVMPEIKNTQRWKANKWCYTQNPFVPSSAPGSDSEGMSPSSGRSSG